MNQPSVSVIVINWNLKETTARCLRSLETLDYACHIITIDNGSCDGSADYIATHFPQVDLIALPTNIGFGAACNYAIEGLLKNTDCDFIFLINNDALVDPHSLSFLVKEASVNPIAGIFSPMIYSADRRDTIWYAGARRRRWVLAATDTGRGQLDRGQYNHRKEVDYVFGTAMLIRRSLIEKIGLFDNQFYLYLEDLDFCVRAQMEGYSLCFVPEAKVWHQGSASTENYESLRRYHLVKSTYFFLKKYSSPRNFLPLVVYWSLVNFRMLLHDFALGKLDVMKSHFLGIVSGFNDNGRAQHDPTLTKSRSSQQKSTFKKHTNV